MGCGASGPAVDPLETMTAEELELVATTKSRNSKVRLSALRPSLCPPIEHGGATLVSHCVRVLKSPADLEDFTAFLMREFASEPLQFYIALQEFSAAFGCPALVRSRRNSEDKGLENVAAAALRRHSDPKPGAAAATATDAAAAADAARAAAAAAIYDEFVKPNAARAVHVPRKIRRALVNDLDAGRASEATFKPAVTAVLGALAKDKLASFVQEQRASRHVWLRALKALDGAETAGHLGGPPAATTRGNSIVRSPHADSLRRLTVDMSEILAHTVELDTKKQHHRRVSVVAAKAGKPIRAWVDPEKQVVLTADL